MQILDPLSDNISSIELIRAGGSDLDVVNAARVSFGKKIDALSEKDIQLIRYLLKHDHTSPFEHTQLVYRVKLPIFVMRHWIRHRIGVSYNEISGRYSESTLDFYTPKKWRIQDPNNKQSSVVAERECDQKHRDMYIKSHEDATKTYKELLEGGICRELARCVLPVSVYTEFIFTCNLVSLFHFVKLRAHPHAQWEIQQYALGLAKLAKKDFPVSIEHWADLKGIDLKEKGTSILGETPQQPWETSLY